MGVADRLKELGIELTPRRPGGVYVPSVRTGNLIFMSGAVPLGPNGMVTGKVGGDLNVEQGQEAARLCVISSLSNLRDEIGDLDRVARIVKLLGFVNSAPGFAEQHTVMDGASNLLLSLFGDRGAHARSSVGMAELPLNMAVEVEMIVEAPE